MVAFKSNLYGLPIVEVKKQYKILSLANIRDYNDCLFLYKLLNGTINSPELLNLISIRAPQVVGLILEKTHYFILYPVNVILLPIDP